MKGHKPMPYCYKIYKDSPRQDHDTLVLCESEFKAAAMWQLGWRAAGLGGVATFSGELFDRLKKLIIEVKPKKVIVLFDTEVQDDPMFANYKDDYRKRYAQYIYSYIMAKKIELEIPDTKSLIAQIPFEWMINNKADIDSCLAAGKGTEHFKMVIDQAIDPETFRKMCKVDREHRPIVERRMERAFNRGSVWEYEGCYYYNKIERIKGDMVKTPVEISNFTMKLRNTIIKGGKTYRSVDLISRYGDYRQNVIINEEQLTGTNKFRQFLVQNGDYSWRGGEPQLNAIVEEMFLDNLDIPIHILDYVGRDEQNKMWIMGNMIIKDDGKILEPKEDNTIWDSTTGYKIDTINVGSVKTSLPHLSVNNIDATEVIEHINTTWGISGIKAFLWTIACFFSNEVMKKEKSFPILFIYGEKESGKSTLSDILMECAGMPSETPASNICETTQVGLTRVLSYYHSIPARFDEYRETDKKTGDKLSLLRSIYNRQGATKGIKEAFGTRQIEINAPLMIIGEQVPNDSALLSRTIICQLSLRDKTIESINSLKWLYKNKSKLSNIAYNIIKKYKENAKVFIDKIEAAKFDMALRVSAVTNMRNQAHYALLMSTLDVIMPDSLQKEKLMGLIYGDFEVTNDVIRNSSSIAQFFEEVYNLSVTQPHLGIDKFVELVPGTNIGYIYLRGIHSVLLKNIISPKDSIFFYYKTISDYILKQYWCKGQIRRIMGVSKDMANKRLRSYTIDLSREDVPDGLMSLFEDKGYVRSEKNNGIDESEESDSIYAEEELD